MKFDFENIGFIDKGSVELADLTLICGPNSVGKTYISYNIYGFIQYFKRFVDLEITDEQTRRLKEDGSLEIDLSSYQKNLAGYLTQASKAYTNTLEEFFSAPEDFFTDSSLRFSDKGFCVDFEKEFQRTAKFGSNESVIFDKQSNQETLSVAYQRTNIEKSNLPNRIMADVVGDAIFDCLFSNALPKPFVITSERTGIALFYKELDINRNKLVEHLSESDDMADPFALLNRLRSRYARPIRHNIDVIRDYDNLNKRKSFLRQDRKKHEKLLKSLQGLMGGKFETDGNGQIFFVPKKERKREKTSVPVYLASSSVKSLFLIDLYINCLAEKDGLLIIDEPELNLHPNNQRKMASLLAQLVNAGIKILITTHSDYLIREINNRIMLSGEINDKQRILEEWEMIEEEILQPKQVKAYSFKPDHTVEEVDVDRHGINMAIFDDLIVEANSLLDDIYYSIKD